MADRTTKALLLAIALGLWANAAGQWLRPNELHAQGLDKQDLAAIAQHVSNIDAALNSGTTKLGEKVAYMQQDVDVNTGMNCTLSPVRIAHVGRVVSPA